jgi:hypothetical protein
MANLIRLARPQPTFTRILFKAYPEKKERERRSLIPTLSRCSRFASAIDSTGSSILPCLMDSARCPVDKFEQIVCADYEADDDTAINSLLQRALLRTLTISTHVDVLDNNQKVSVWQELRGDDDTKEFDGFTTQSGTHVLQLDSQSDALTA